MATTNPDPDKEGFSQNIVRVIEAILTVGIVAAGTLSAVISPYFTVSVMLVLAVVLLVFVIKIDSNKTKRYADRLAHERELTLQERTLALAKPNMDNILYQQAVNTGKMTLTAQLISEFKRLADDQTLSAKDREIYAVAVKKLEELTRLVQTGL